MKIALLYPGQGSQFIGMAKEFVERESACNAVMETAESLCDFPIRKRMFSGPMEELTRSAVLQPAITVANLVCLQALRQRLSDNVEISCCAGHSLGEYAALAAAGVISFEDAIRLVERRGFYMGREGERNPGGMRAVLGLGVRDVEMVVNGYRGDGVVTVANYNTPQQLVISGNKTALDIVSEKIKEKGGTIIPLNVSVANHSPLVAEAANDFAAFMKAIPFNKPNVPIYVNVSAGRESDPVEIKRLMARQIAAPVRWCEIIQAMLDDGVDTFIETGPKNVLKGMMRRIVPKGKKVTSVQFDTPDTLDSCLAKTGL